MIKSIVKVFFASTQNITLFFAKIDFKFRKLMLANLLFVESF